MPTSVSPDTGAKSGLARPIATTLALKLIALAVLYFAFFNGPADPTPRTERTAAAVFGLPSAR